MITILVTHDCPHCSDAIAYYPEAEVIVLEDLEPGERAAWCSEAIAAGWDLSYPCVIDGKGEIINA